MSDTKFSRSKATTSLFSAPSRAPPRDTEISSSQLSPRTPLTLVPKPSETATSRQPSKASSSHRSSWPPPLSAVSSRERTEAQEDERRRSTVTFARPKSLAPTDSISQAKSRPGGRMSQDSGTIQASQASRSWSEPYAAVPYRDSYSKTSSRSGPAYSGTSGAPLTETNLGALNEKGARRTVVEEDDREYEVDTSKSKSRRPPRPSTATDSDEQQVPASRFTKKTRRSSWRNTEPIAEEDEEVEDRTAATSRRRGTFPYGGRDGTRNSYAAGAATGIDAAANSRAKDTSVSSSHGPRTVRTLEKQSSPASESTATNRESRAKATERLSAARESYAATNAPAKSEPSQSKVQTAVAASKATKPSFSRSTTNESTSKALAAPPARPSGPSSAGAPTSPTSAAEPSWDWVRKTRIIDSVQRDGRIIRDQEVTMRRIRPVQAVGA